MLGEGFAYSVVENFAYSAVPILADPASIGIGEQEADLEFLAGLCQSIFE